MADKRIKLDRFLTLAARDFATKPYAQVSIARIAKEAGISTATAFAAYESKENVYRLSSGRQMPACLSGSPKVLSTTRPLDRLLDLLMMRAAALCEPDLRQFALQTLANMPMVTNAMVQNWEARVSENLEVLAGACRDAQREGLLLKRPPDDLALTITGRLNAETILFGFMIRESRNPAPLPPSRVALKSIDLFLTATGRRIADSWLTRQGAAASAPA
jgi:AcrR family transcriptional regulator